MHAPSRVEDGRASLSDKRTGPCGFKGPRSAPLILCAECTSSELEEGEREELERARDFTLIRLGRRVEDLVEAEAVEGRHDEARDDLRGELWAEPELVKSGHELGDELLARRLEARGQELLD